MDELREQQNVCIEQVYFYKFVNCRRVQWWINDFRDMDINFTEGIANL